MGARTVSCNGVFGRGIARDQLVDAGSGNAAAIGGAPLIPQIPSH